MKAYETKDLRNMGIFGHGGCGKTTLVEAMAFNAGLIDRMGRVEEGSTVSDYDPEEVRRAISISSALVPLEFNNYKINVVDTPGYFDFVGEKIATLRVVDSAVVVVDAVGGVEVGTEKAFEAVKNSGIPSMVMINKMDRENANFEKVVQQLRGYFGNTVVPFLIPMGEAQTFEGIVNVVDMKAKVKKGPKCVDAKLPPTMAEEIAMYREMIIESVAQTSEELMEKYFDGEELTPEEIQQGLKQGVLNGDLVPVVCGSAAQNIGVETLMNAILNFFPAPNEGGLFYGTNLKQDEIIERSCTADQPFSALVFKTIVDPYVGKLSLFKVMSGTLCPNEEVYNISQGKKEKMSHLYVLKGKKQVEVNKLNAGDLGAFSKLQFTTTGDTLCDVENPILYETIGFPPPIISQAIVPKAKGDEDKIGIGLQRLAEEDPTFMIHRNRETKETLISGQGEMHLEIISKRLYNKFGGDVLLKDPRIPYRETIKGKATSEGKHKKQSGGRGQYGHIYVDFEPLLNDEEGFEFVDKVVGGAVPRQYIPAVEKGLRECLEEGVLGKFPVTGVRCTLFDGSFHSVDSDEMSFKMAASLAFRKGIKEASPVLLEPIYHLEILVPDEYMGDVIGDLNKKRGRILGMEPIEGKQKIIGEAPLAEIFKYATDLRSMTQARGEFMMEFARYEEVPEHLAEKVIQESQSRE